MSFEVRLSQNAVLDLDGIFRYIATKLQAPLNAKGQLDRLENAIYSLETMPERNKLYDKEPWKSRNLRKMFVDNYIVFYLVDNDNKIVNVIRIMYAKRDIPKHLV